MANILIIDDDEAIARLLSRKVEGLGHTASFSPTIKEGFEKLSVQKYEVVFLDVLLPGENGLEALPKIREAPSAPEVIIMTGFSSQDGAEIAIRNGAWDYLEKPFSSEEMTLSLKRVLQYKEALGKASRPPVALKTDGIVGSGKRIRDCYNSLAQAAGCDASILITGETGTGKELFAKAIHHNSARAGNNFVVVDCAALPETLVETTLFGYAKGAFTGADRSQDGLISQADGGTLFLDEVGELPLADQRSLLRVLQERRFRPIGSNKEESSDFRLISATNRDLDAMVEDKLFRPELIFRLRSLTLHLPPLRERPEDIRDLATYFMGALCESYNLGSKGFSSDFFTYLSSYDWPGNVRELANAMDRAFAEAKYEPVIFPKHLPDRIRIQVKRASLESRSDLVPQGRNEHQRPFLETPITYKEFKESSAMEAEKSYFESLIAASRGNIKKACLVSGLSRSRLYALLKKHGISTSGWDLLSISSKLS